MDIHYVLRKLQETYIYDSGCEPKDCDKEILNTNFYKYLVVRLLKNRSYNKEISVRIPQLHERLNDKMQKPTKYACTNQSLNILQPRYRAAGNK